MESTLSNPCEEKTKTDVSRFLPMIVAAKLTDVDLNLKKCLLFSDIKNDLFKRDTILRQIILENSKKKFMAAHYIIINKV